jgi:hypothetical protein
MRGINMSQRRQPLLNKGVESPVIEYFLAFLKGLGCSEMLFADGARTLAVGFAYNHHDSRKRLDDLFLRLNLKNVKVCQEGNEYIVIVDNDQLNDCIARRAHHAFDPVGYVRRPVVATGVWCGDMAHLNYLKPKFEPYQYSDWLKHPNKETIISDDVKQLVNLIEKREEKRSSEVKAAGYDKTVSNYRAEALQRIIHTGKTLREEAKGSFFDRDRNLKLHKVNFLNIISTLAETNPRMSLKVCTELAQAKYPKLYELAIKGGWITGRTHQLIKDLKKGENNVLPTPSPARSVRARN